MWVHPVMLAWIGGAALPLVLHLLTRSQYRAVDWGAMIFLTGQQTRTDRASLKQYLLLLLRMGIVGLMAITLARPIINSRFSRVPTAGLSLGGPTAVVIILDDSASMGYIVNNRSRLDAAREVTLQILSELKRGDQAALLLAGNRNLPPPPILSADLQSIAATIADLQPSTSGADFAADLNRAADLLDHTSASSQQIYLISDRQADSYRNITESFKKSWKVKKNGNGPPPVTVIMAAGNESDNIAIDGIDFPDSPIIRDQNSEMQIRVHNYGSMPCSEVPLNVWSGSHALGEATIALPAHAVQVVTLPARFYEAGAHVVSAAVHSTGLTSDDRLDVSADVLEPVQVLVVVDDAATSGAGPLADSSAALLRMALMPFGVSGHRGTDPAIVTTMVQRAWNADFFKKFTVIVLADVPKLSAEQANDLEQFTAAGGGVLFLPGGDSNWENFNAVLYRDGSGLMPAKLSPPVSPVQGTFINASSLDRQSTIARSVVDQVESLSGTPVVRYLPAFARGKNASTIARYTTGDPFVIESSFGRGHVVLMTTAIDLQWNALSRSSLFLPVMQSIVRYLAASKSIDRNLSLGQPLVERVDGPVDDRSATVQFQPGGQREPATVLRVGDQSQVRYGRTNRIGSYRLRYRIAGKEISTSFTVMPARRESDLTPLTEDQWRTLTGRVGFERVDLARTTVASAVDRQRGGREIWIDLIGCVLLLMTIEMMFSRYWS